MALFCVTLKNVCSKLPWKYQGYHQEMEISGICIIICCNVKLWDALCSIIVKLLYLYLVK